MTARTISGTRMVPHPNSFPSIKHTCIIFPVENELETGEIGFPSIRSSFIRIAIQTSYETDVNRFTPQLVTLLINHMPEQNILNQFPNPGQIFAFRKGGSISPSARGPFPIWKSSDERNSHSQCGPCEKSYQRFGNSHGASALMEWNKNKRTNSKINIGYIA